MCCIEPVWKTITAWLYETNNLLASCIMQFVLYTQSTVGVVEERLNWLIHFSGCALQELWKICANIQAFTTH